MTTTDDRADAEPADADAADAHPAEAGTEDGGAAPDERRSPVVSELLLALEVTALAAFTFARPVLDSFGRSPETFVALHATTSDIVLFGLVVAFVPGLALAAVGTATRLLGPRVRRDVHLVLVAVLGGLAAWRLGRDVTGWPNDATKLLVAGLVAGPSLALLRRRVPATATFLRYAGAASVIFLAQFLFTSPTSDVAFGPPTEVDTATAGQVAADLDDDPPSVVFVVLDALPTTSLLDGTGHVDAELFPNIGALAATSTWYRNNTTVAAFTGQAVPALLTGRYPPAGSAVQPPDPANLFTLLGGSYDLHVKEQITQLCPEDLCPRGGSAGVGRLVSEAVAWWRGPGGEKLVVPNGFDLPGVLGDDRYEVATQWIDDLRIDPGGRPDLTFLHVVLPHPAWQFTEDGTIYDMQGGLPTGGYGLGWTQAGYEVGRQRHLLQAQLADRLVGRLMDRLSDAGVLDDSLVVLTADHGEAFVPDALTRGVARANVPYVMWTPLFVKAPGQTEGAVDDSNVEAIDLVPTIADELGVDLPWDVDGLPVARAGTGRDPNRKFVADNDANGIHPGEGEDLIEVDGRDHFGTVLAADPVAARGPDAVWKRSPHGEALFGRDVDDLRIGEPAGRQLVLEAPGGLDSIDTGEPLPIEMIGHADLDLGTVVAYALNGTVGAVTSAEPWVQDDRGPLVHGLVPPDLFEDGANELTAYVVEGPPGDETLRPLEIVR